MGYLTKKGAIVKNWKKRYFVVNPDYSVDYFENEEVRHSLFYFDSQYTFVIGLYLLLCEHTYSLMNRPMGKVSSQKVQFFHAAMKSLPTWMKQ